MVMLITPRVIAKMDKIAIFAIMAAIVMANGNLSMAIRGIPLKGIDINLFFHSDIISIFCDFVIFTALLQCEYADYLRPILIKLVHHMSKLFGKMLLRDDQRTRNCLGILTF